MRLRHPAGGLVSQEAKLAKGASKIEDALTATYTLGLAQRSSGMIPTPLDHSTELVDVALGKEDHRPQHAVTEQSLGPTSTRSISSSASGSASPKSRSSFW